MSSHPCAYHHRTIIMRQYAWTLGLPLVNKKEYNSFHTHFLSLSREERVSANLGQCLILSDSSHQLGHKIENRILKPRNQIIASEAQVKILS